MIRKVRAIIIQMFNYLCSNDLIQEHNMILMSYFLLGSFSFRYDHYSIVHLINSYIARSHYKATDKFLQHIIFILVIKL